MNELLSAPGEFVATLAPSTAAADFRFGVASASYLLSGALGLDVMQIALILVPSPWRADSFAPSVDQ